MSYVVATPVFEGPLETLYQLISRHDVDVVDVPLAPVVEGFVAELDARRAEMELAVASEFLLYAAILLELKSRALLPKPEPVEEDEELAGWDSRDALLARLLECRAYAAAGEAFAVLAEAAARSLPRLVGLDEGFVVHAPDLLRGVSAADLVAAYRRATSEPSEPVVDLSHVTVDTITVAETVTELATLLPDRPPTTFSALVSGLRTRIEVIVRFLALLELCKLGKVALGQGRTFGDLEVRWLGGATEITEADVDRYEG